MAKKRVRNWGEKEKDLEPNSVKMDRLSALPGHIIDQIFSLVPTIDAVQMSILSKHWRHMWYSLSALEFSDDSFVGQFKSQKLSTFVDNCLDFRKNDMLNDTPTPVTKFKLDTSCSCRNIGNWLRLVARSHIKELDLRICPYLYSLPLDILCVRSLTHLRLSGIQLEHLHSASLPSLLSLSLVRVVLDDQVLRNLLSGCFCLEKLLLQSCTGLSDPEVSTLTLKFLEFDDNICASLQVRAVNLESFVCLRRYKHLKLNLSVCETLKSLSLSSSTLDYQRLEYLVSRLPCIESLTLCCDSKWKCVKICSEHLKHFTWKVDDTMFLQILDDASCHEDLQFAIDTPNLRHFCFHGYPAGNISVNAPNLLEAYFILFASRYDLSWYINVLNFLSSFDCSADLCLSFNSVEAVIFPNTVRKACRAPLPTVKTLRVKTDSSFLRHNDLKDSLFWATPSLETLSIEQEGDI